MCELFGFSSQTEKDLSAYLNEFFSHSDAHPNGWGLANFSDNNNIELHTECVSANESNVLPKLLSENTIFSNVFAHIRRATIGNVRIENCHPFIESDSNGCKWTLMHNGTIFSGTELVPYQKIQKGSSDSERILLYLIDNINSEIRRNGRALGSYEKFKVVEKVISDLSYRNKINLIIYDGEQMYVHCNMKNTLFSKNIDGGVLFSTVPLDYSPIWQPVELTRLLVYKSGELIYKGKVHHNEYTDVMGLVPERYNYAI